MSYRQVRRASFWLRFGIARHLVLAGLFAGLAIGTLAVAMPLWARVVIVVAALVELSLVPVKRWVLSRLPRR